MVCPWNHGMDMESWYGHGLMVLTTPMALTLTHGIASVLLNHAPKRGPSAAHMQDSFFFGNPFMSRNSSKI